MRQITATALQPFNSGNWMRPTSSCAVKDSEVEAGERLGGTL